MNRRDRIANDDLGAAGLLSRLHMLLHAAATSPADAGVLKLALIQAAAATGADSAVLGTMRDRDLIDVTLLPGAGDPVHDVGVLPVGSRYPLTDVILRGRPVWLTSPREIRLAYPVGGALWGFAFAGAPLLLRGVPIGAVGLIHDNAAHCFTAVERVFVSAVADVCATVLSHTRASSPLGNGTPVADG
ncbi:GAF domain-containing protein [Actinoplanes sp. NPDC049681]|uniref:GAF domain-containing protein n=1 Tax=Actinoplanes sp. NPDC049681 TaxID=3363905 RepID=UPI0037A17DBF